MTDVKEGVKANGYKAQTKICTKCMFYYVTVMDKLVFSSYFTVCAYI